MIYIYMYILKITIFNLKTQYFDWAIFNSYISHYQKVTNMYVKQNHFTMIWQFPRLRTPQIMHFRFGSVTIQLLGC